jgi:hypothetical protein
MSCQPAPARQDRSHDARLIQVDSPAIAGHYIEVARVAWGDCPMKDRFTEEPVTLQMAFERTV